MTASVEVQVARGALMEIGRPDLVPLIFGNRMPWCWPTVAQAMLAFPGRTPGVLGHQVHDRTAHLCQVEFLNVCCPSCGGCGVCDEHGRSAVAS